MDDKGLGVAELASLCGRAETDVARVFMRWPSTHLLYRELEPANNERVWHDVEATIREAELRTVGGDDPTVWERGWGEVASRLHGQELDIEDLRPQYFTERPCRLFGRYVQPADPEFEYALDHTLRRLAFDEFLAPFGRIVEFGSGTGISIMLLAEQLPGRQLIGTDWASATREILSEIARQTGQAISGHFFNMLTAEGWDGGAIDDSTAVLSVHAMEQLGPNWRNFAEFLWAHKPGLCVHLEPLLELYDPRSAFDDLARRYHLKRGYLEGFLPYVQEQASAGKAEVVTARRVQFGSLNHEAYSILAWRPL